MRDKTPWYSVVDVKSWEKVFETRFFNDTFDSKSSGFTFDAPNGETWLCHEVDEDTFTIFGESMDSYMTRAIGEYLATIGDTDIEDEVSYYVVDGE